MKGASRLLLERAMGFEPTTASLEGWNSTTELRPPFVAPVNHTKVLIRFGSFQAQQARRLKQSLVWWAGKDSNLGRHKPADLQSAPFGHLGTCPPSIVPFSSFYPTKNSAQIQNIFTRISALQRRVNLYLHSSLFNPEDDPLTCLVG